MVSGQWISFSSSSVSFFSRGKAWTSSAARRVSMMEMYCRTCREASSVKASGNKRLGCEVVGVELRKRNSQVDAQNVVTFEVMILVGRDAGSMLY